MDYNGELGRERVKALKYDYINRGIRGLIFNMKSLQMLQMSHLNTYYGTTANIKFSLSAPGIKLKRQILTSEVGPAPKEESVEH